MVVDEFPSFLYAVHDRALFRRASSFCFLQFLPKLAIILYQFLVIAFEVSDKLLSVFE